jgi:hypothetical protein
VLYKRGVLEGGSVVTYVKVTLTIGTSIDAEYSPAEHVDDIIENTRRLFPAAEVTVLEVTTDPLGEPKQITERCTL